MPSSPFMEELRQHMIVRRYSKRTIESYSYWIRFYIRYHGKRHPAEMGKEQVLAFLNFLAVQRRVSIAPQKIALSALAFLYNKYIGQQLGNLGGFNRFNQPRKLPVVLTRQEMARLLANMRGQPALLAALLYGSGLRRIEGVRLRVRDVDIDHLQLRIWGER